MYLYAIPRDATQQPEWFRTRLRRAVPEDWPLDRTWVWNWNDIYERKITIRDGSVNLVFNDEADYMWFILSEL
jgi:hypothetical protein